MSMQLELSFEGFGRRPILSLARDVIGHLVPAVLALFLSVLIIAAPCVASPQAQQESWVPFLRSVGGYPEAVMVDLEAADFLEEPGNREVLTIQVDFSETTFDRLPSRNEFPRIYAVEDALAPIAASGESARYLGRIIGNGTLQMFVVRTRTDAALVNQLSMRAAELGYEASIEISSDPEVKVYWSRLHPTNDQLRVASDGSVIRALADAGDQPEIPREIEHWAYFPDRAAADAFAQIAYENDFQAITVSEAQDGPDQFVVRCVREGRATLDDVTAQTLVLDRAARANGGTYDGWETAVMRGQ
jgi:regulator of RNase E activity RraB